MTYVYIGVAVLTVLMFLVMLNEMLYAEHSIVYRLFDQNKKVYDWTIAFMCLVMSVSFLVLFRTGHRHTACVIAANMVITLIFFCLYVRIIEMDVQNNLAASALPKAPDKTA